MTLLNSLKSVFHSSSTGSAPLSGLHHYVRENEQEKSRIHLRIDADGHGTLIVNANRILHLNPTAALMAYHTLEGTPEKDAVHQIRQRYHVGQKQAETDFASIKDQLEELVRPDGACPIHDMGLETVMPFSTRPTAPYRLDLALTYRCNNDCAHCYNARERNFPELSTEQWFKVLDQLWALGVPHIVFTGGEATLRNDLPELIAHCASPRRATRSSSQYSHACRRGCFQLVTSAADGAPCRRTATRTGR